MNRRQFLGGLLALIPGVSLLKKSRGPIIHYRANSIGIYAELQRLRPFWYQTERWSACHSPEYKTALLNELFHARPNPAGLPRSSFLECSRKWDASA